MSAAEPTTPTPTRSLSRRYLFLAVALTMVVWAATMWARPIAFHLLRPAITGEAERLAEALRITVGDSAAEVGAGDGALAVAIARHVQPGGIMYATELDQDRLRQLHSVAAAKLVVIEATESSVSLPERCCDAVFMRNVYHHIGNPARFNAELRHALRPGGRLAVIDFEPGAIPFLSERPTGTSRTGHGVTAQAVMRELQAAGFRIERSDAAWGGWMFLVVAVAPGAASHDEPRASHP